jgi:hypothetical protein
LWNGRLPATDGSKNAGGGLVAPPLVVLSILLSSRPAWLDAPPRLDELAVTDDVEFLRLRTTTHPPPPPLADRTRYLGVDAVRVRSEARERLEARDERDLVDFMGMAVVGQSARVGTSVMGSESSSSTCTSPCSPSQSWGSAAEHPTPQGLLWSTWAILARPPLPPPRLHPVHSQMHTRMITLE